MAEPSKEHAIELLNLLCREKGLLEEKRFQVSAEPGRQDADYFITDGDCEIGVQLSSVEEMPGWNKSSSHLDQVMSELRGVYKKLRVGVNVDLVFKSLPYNKGQRHDLVEAFRLFMRQVSGKVSGEPGVEIRLRDKQELLYLNLLMKYLSEIKISGPTATEHVVFQTKEWVRSGFCEEDVAAELLAQMIRKNQKYTPGSRGGILLFEVRPTWLTEREIGEVQRLFDKGNFYFSEVWIVSIALPGYCIRL